jgi:hypothetical protein
MTKKINKLTDEQIARFSEFVERWKKIGLSTERADRPKAEQAAKEAYKEANLTPPELIVWCDSPLSLPIVDSVLKTGRDSVEASVGDSVQDSVEASVWASVQDSVWVSVWNSVRDSVQASVRDSVKVSVWNSVQASVQDSVEASVWASVQDSVWASVWNSVRDSVWASVWDSVRDSVKVSVWNSVKVSVGDSVYGQHEAGWLSFYSYFLEACNLEACKRLLPLMKYAESSGWWIPRKGVILLSERPIRCGVNERGLLHNNTGKMAIEYPDGFGVYAVNGVRLPEKYGSIKSNDWKPEWILEEQNQEIKRLFLETIPKEKVESVLNLHTLDTFKTEYSTYELVEAKNNPYPSPYKALRMSCPTTGKPYLIRVEPEIKSAETAVVRLNKGIHPTEFMWEC